jgi:hypothetical protein
MPAGVTNPKGRRNLNETSRDMLRPFFITNDKKLFPKKKVIREKPFLNIQDKTDRKQIKVEIFRLLYYEKKGKSVILKWLREKFDFNKIEAENLYFASMTMPKHKARLRRMKNK